MSIVFVPKRQRGTAKINQETIQRVSELTPREQLTTVSLCLLNCVGSCRVSFSIYVNHSFSSLDFCLLFSNTFEHLVIFIFYDYKIEILVMVHG